VKKKGMKPQMITYRESFYEKTLRYYGIKYF
jgi:hypothetical protein